jgi:hypothetical protein
MVRLGEGGKGRRWGGRAGRAVIFVAGRSVSGLLKAVRGFFEFLAESPLLQNHA